MRKIFLYGLLAGVLMLVVGLALSQIFNFVFPSLKAEYMNENLIRPWSDPVMSLYFVYPFVFGILAAWVWSKVKPVVPGQTPWQKAWRFALAGWIVSNIPGMLMSYSTFPISLLMVVSWSLSSLIQFVIAGWVYARFIK